MLRKTKLRRVSKKRVKVNREYMRLRDEFLKAHPICQWWLLEAFKSTDIENCEFIYFNQNGMGGPPSTEIHHKKGRGRYLLDASTWMAVSEAGHKWIHANPKISYEKGYMLPRN